MRFTPKQLAWFLGTQLKRCFLGEVTRKLGEPYVQILHNHEDGEFGVLISDGTDKGTQRFHIVEIPE